MILLPDIILRDFEGFISTTSHAHPYFHRLAVNMFPAHMGYDTPIWRKARGLCWSGLVHTGIQFQFADLNPLSLLYKRILHFEDFGARLNYWYTRVIVCVLTSLIRERERGTQHAKTIKPWAAGVLKHSWYAFGIPCWIQPVQPGSKLLNFWYLHDL